MPNIEAMAKERRKLRSFYADSICSPSRAMLMTGGYPKRCTSIPGALFQANCVELSPNVVAVAKVRVL